MDQIAAYFKDLPNILPLMEKHPFGTMLIFILALAYVVVLGIRAWRHPGKK